MPTDKSEHAEILLELFAERENLLYQIKFKQTQIEELEKEKANYETSLMSIDEEISNLEEA